MTSSELPILYSYFRSSCAWRVRNALALKEIEYEYRAVNLLKGEQISESYKDAQNPMGQVPIFIYKDFQLTQSIAIMEFLEETFPEVPILPKDPIERAKAREISEVIGSGIQPIQNLAVLKQLDEDKRLQWGHDAIKKGFVAVEKLLTTSAGKYCVGDTVTIADCCLVPQVYNAATRFKVDMNEFPQIQRINNQLSSLDSFKKAHYTNQIDCPVDLK